MDINELESYRLSDAVKFNDQLNPRIWGPDERMLPEVRTKLLEIAEDFQQFLGIPDLDIRDITISGSNAAYTYTPHSDIDLHLVADLPQADTNEVYRELFDAKKYQYNDQHNFTIGGYDVELYVQDPHKPHHSQGIYSVLKDEWIRVPRRRRPEVDDISVRSKYQDIGNRIEQAIESGELDRMDAVAKKIKTLRQAGLDKTGEFGPENLAFKILRTNGTLDRLRQARLEAKDRLMSITERRKKKTRRQWGVFGGYHYPGYGYYGTGGDAGGDSGGDGGESRSVSESRAWDQDQMLADFVEFATTQLGLESRPRMKFKRDPAWSERNNTFGRYVPEEHTLYVSVANRHPLDIMRTIAHELVHHRQNEVADMPERAGDTGSDWENQANAMAGIIMRKYADLHPETFDNMPLNEVDRQADTHEDYDPNGPPPGPETKPTMPAGTVRVDVSDVYDWYKLGQHISNLRGLGKHDFGKGPPSTILSFGDENTEHKYIQDLEKTGLTTTDVDPVDPRQPPGMKRQKTDPTYNVNEASGYIPTDAEKDDPRFKMALTVDVKPGQTGREANKLGLKTDSQGRPQLLMKRLANLLEETKLDEKCWTGYRQQGMKKKGDRRVPNCVPVNEEEDLLEVKMSPGELRRWAESPEAEGIRAGFEAEMIFRDTSGGESEDPEPDYDMDERASDIDNVLDFFRGGEGGISGGMANRLRENLWEEYVEWRESAIYNQFAEVAEEQVRDYMETNIWGDEDQRDQYRERAAEDLGIETSEQSAERAEEIEARARELFDADVEQSIADEDRNYDEAREYYRDMMVDSDEFDQSDWFRNNYSHMSDVADAFGLDWPYYTGGREGTGSRSVEDIAGSLQYAIDMPVVASSNYHGATRRPGRWIIEPDGSLDPDEPDDELGLEIVSPPMPLPETLRKLQQVIDWANGDGDAYTNSSTGLHMGMSIPFKGGDVDYIKLILFMGDQYVLDRFDRAANTYCASALEKLRQTQTARRRGVRENVRGWDNEPAGKMTGAEKTAAAMDLMRKNLIELAQQLVQDGVGLSKYTSAHIKDGYIEFRSPGGDYLSLNDREDQALEDTMLRFARAMYIAGRPDVERREYAKKLYKLLDPQDNESLRLFLDYSTGKLNSEELKKQWAEQVLAKEAPPPRSRDDAREYEVIRRDTGEVIDTIQDYTLASANETALVKYSGKGFDWSVREKTDAEPEKKLSRRAQVAKKIRERPSIWRVTDTNTGRSITVAADGVLDAKYQARNQDKNFKKLFYNDPDSILVEPASAEEVKQYQVQQADNRKDSEQVQQRAQGTGSEQRYRVSWVERRDGQEVEDSVLVDAASAEGAEQSIRFTLEMLGRDVISIGAALAGSTQDRAQQRAQTQQSAGEFTGRWQIRDALSGEVLHTIGGIGNVQYDANRYAREWIERTGYSGAYEIVPEMR